ncbi:hypothetical protein ACVWW4_001281 [Bradyrhizobium sp. LB7.1]
MVAAGRSDPSAGKWLRGAFVTLLFAGGSAAATVAWENHGDTARQLLAEWTPALASLLPSTSQTAPVAAAQAAPPAEQAATATDQAAADQATDQSVAPPPTQVAAAVPTATQSDPVQSVQSMTRDLAAMAQQIEQLKVNIAELKAGQEQMAREMAKPPAPKPMADAKPPVDPRARVSRAASGAAGSQAEAGRVADLHAGLFACAARTAAFAGGRGPTASCAHNDASRCRRRWTCRASANAVALNDRHATMQGCD